MIWLFGQPGQGLAGPSPLIGIRVAMRARDKTKRFPPVSSCFGRQHRSSTPQPLGLQLESALNIFASSILQLLSSKGTSCSSVSSILLHLATISMPPFPLRLWLTLVLRRRQDLMHSQSNTRTRGKHLSSLVLYPSRYSPASSGSALR